MGEPGQRSVDTPSRPVEDSVAKVDDELAVGEDLKFQRRWWTFERWIWRFFALIVLADLLGAFGRGPLANAHKASADNALVVHYERIERFSTPSILTIHTSAAAVHGGVIRLWMSNSIITRLGNQRIIPEPATSLTVHDGVIYTFPSGSTPGTVAFALQPADPGPAHFTIRLLTSDAPGQPPQDSLTARVFVMP